MKHFSINNSLGFVHHIVLVAIITVVGVASIGTFGIIQSSAEKSSTSRYAISATSEKGCELAGRKYSKTTSTCLKECQYPNASRVNYRQPTNNADTGYCTTYVRPGATPEDKDWCLNNVHRYFINNIGCARKHNQDTSTANAIQCQPEFPNYIARGETDYCIATKSTANTISTPAASSIKVIPSASSPIPVAVSPGTPTVATASTTKDAATITTVSADKNNACGDNSTSRLVYSAEGEQSLMCLTSAEAPSCASGQVLVEQDATGVANYSCQSATTTSRTNGEVQYQKIDPRIGIRACSLLGRSYINGYTRNDGSTVRGGCSRITCMNEGDFMLEHANAEYCRKGGPGGPAYASIVNYKRCYLLHRYWIPEVNLCITNPDRAPATVNAIQCRAPYTTYVVHNGKEDMYDECIKPSAAERFKAIAKSTGTPFSKVSAMRSKTLCSFRGTMEWRQGLCQKAARPIDESKNGGTVMIGDSVTWRGTNELSKLRPGWTMDGDPGRMAAALPERIKFYLRSHVPPKVLIIALGTNPGGGGWKKADYVASTKLVPSETKIMFVIPYREYGTGEADVVKRSRVFGGWMREIARERPNTCVADWSAKARSHPNILVDGIHQTPAGEKVWAKFISNSWDQCR